MPFALLIVGLVLLISAIRNTHRDLYALLRGDFTGEGNFAYWLISILLIGAVGYIKELRPVSTAFLVLVILVLVLTRGNPNSPGGGFFDAFTKALNSIGDSTQSSGTQPPSTQKSSDGIPSIPPVNPF